VGRTAVGHASVSGAKITSRVAANMSVGRIAVSGAVVHASASGAKMTNRVAANISRLKRRRAKPPGDGEMYSSDDQIDAVEHEMQQESAAEGCALHDLGIVGQFFSDHDQVDSPVLDGVVVSDSAMICDVAPGEAQPQSLSLHWEASNPEISPGQLDLLKDDSIAELSKFEGCHWHISPEEDAEAVRPHRAPNSQSGLADPRWVAAGLGEHEQQSLPMPPSGGGVPGASKFEHPGWAITQEAEVCHGPPMVPRTNWYRSSPGMQGASSPEEPPLSPSSSTCSDVSELGEKAAHELLKRYRKIKRDIARCEQAAQ